jgi:hypothetical protein
MKSIKNTRIEAAMQLLDSQSTLNYTAAAKASQIHSTTLARRYRGETSTQEEANSTFY